jgi:hypothetical protein
MNNKRIVDRLQAILDAEKSMKAEFLENPDPEYFDEIVELFKDSIANLIEDINDN